jgi:hypothetical protein
MSTTQPSNVNPAIIGGVVGGVIPLLIVIGVVAFCSARKRKKIEGQASQSQSQSQSQSSSIPQNEYGRIAPQEQRYDDIQDVRAAEFRSSEYDDVHDKFEM